MNPSFIVACAVVAMLLSPAAAAWSSANRYGGSTEHSYGQTSHTNAYGGSTSHAYGEGTEHTNMYGGSTAHACGGGTEHTNVYGGRMTSSPGPISRPPSVVVNALVPQEVARQYFAPVSFA